MLDSFICQVSAYKPCEGNFHRHICSNFKWYYIVCFQPTLLWTCYL